MTTELTEQELNKQVTTMVDQAGHLLVKDAESLDVANELLVNLSNLRKKRVAWFKDLVDKAHQAHKALTKRRSEALEPIDKADSVVRSLTSAYVAKERERERKAQEKLDKIAEDKAERETEKLLKKAEKEKDPEVKEELVQKAENIYEEPKIAKPTVEKTSRVGGGGTVTFTPDIEIEVINIKDTCAAVIAGHLPESVVDFKVSKIKAYVKMMDIKEGVVKGIRITEKQKQSVRGG